MWMRVHKRIWGVCAMDQSSTELESELRISPEPVLAGLLLLGAILYLWAETTFRAWAEVDRILSYCLVLSTLSVTGWLLVGWNDSVGRWFTVTALIIAFHLGHRLLGVPGFLAFLPIPIVLTAALISPTAATASAIAQTVLLLWLSGTAVASNDGGATGPMLIAIWATLGTMVAAYRPGYQIAHWSRVYAQQAHTLLEDTRDHQLDLTQVQEDLVHVNLQLTRMNSLAHGLRQVAEEARTAKEQFVANVSHELRTPLNMITGFSEMILQTPETYGDTIPSALLADLAVIHRNAEHLSELIDDVLDLSQIEADQMALIKEHVRFNEIVETATMAVRPLFDSKGLYLEAEVSEDIPLIFCDRTRIREVLLNLLSNAGRFTERGGVRLRAWSGGNDLMVAVSDTGPGIPSEAQSKLFQPFQQLESSIRRRTGGTGLGLSISKRFIELHGGHIWIDSEPGAGGDGTTGTTFTFRLPVAPPEPLSDDSFWHELVPDWEHVQHTRPSKAPKPMVRPRLLVVETGDVLQRLLVRYLDGVETEAVSSLGEATAALSRMPADALLVNSASVSETLRHLTANALPPSRTPVIVCSIPGVREASAALGVFDLLVKPVAREVLLDALDRLGLNTGTILIVDDEPDALQLIGRMLAASGRGYRTLLARDGHEALNILQESRPDVILLDLSMPNMDGFQVLEQLSHDPARHDIPVIVISAQDPASQPIVSHALAVTQTGGLSVRQILTSIEFLTKTLSAPAQVGGPMLRESLLDEPVCG